MTKLLIASITTMDAMVLIQKRLKRRFNTMDAMDMMDTMALFRKA